MKHNFRGWNTVFHFTFRQSTKTTGFRLVTILIALVIMGASIFLTILGQKPEKEGNIYISPVQKVIVADNSGLSLMDYKQLNPIFMTEAYNHITFETRTDITREEAIDMVLEDAGTLTAVIDIREGGYHLEVITPSGSFIGKGDANKLEEALIEALQTNKLLQSGLTNEQLTSVLKPMVTSVSEIGETSNGFIFVLKIFAPMIFGLLLYMMLLMHGQTVSKAVSTEKTSKLVETLLTSIHPYALISGKVLAISFMSIFQFILWIASLFGGLYLGNYITKSIYPEYQSTLAAMLQVVQDNIGESAFTIWAVLLTIIVFFLGLLFYFLLAGMAGCMVSKPEDVATTQGIFQFPVIISFLVTYFAFLPGNNSLQVISRYIPFTAPFSLPVDILLGTIGLGEGLIATLLLLIFTVLAVMISGRIYKGLILYNGQSLNLKMIGNILKNNS